MTTLKELVGSRWTGKSELWEDPLGDVPQRSDCTIAVDEGVVEYTWRYKDKEHVGTLKLRAGGGEFCDTWHQSEPIACEDVPGSNSLATVRYNYMGDWGWRINLCWREPSGELVIQMTNIAPWGEEARAVRMVCKRDPA